MRQPLFFSMIVIILDKFDKSTVQISEHLLKMGEDVFCLRTIDFFSSVEINYDINENQCYFYLEGKPIKSIWFKKNSTWHTINNSPNYEYFKYYEMFTILDSLASHSINSPTLIFSNFCNSSLNKISVLQTALKVGLEIPHSLITNVSDKVNFDKSYISKAAYENFMTIKGGEKYCVFNEVLEEEMVKTEFLPSFIQSKIDKKFEIRTLIFADKEYSVCIEVRGESVDSRSPKVRKRFFPIELPKTYSLKLNKLMLELNLTIGVFDTLVDQKGNYYFLEVNPNGSFSDIIKHCQYPIIYDISKILSDGKN